MPETEYDHGAGDIVTLNDRLTAIGGLLIRKVEVFEKSNWNKSVIPDVGNYEGKIGDFSTLVIENTLYLFGGADIGTNLNEVWKYNSDLIREWQKETPLIYPMARHRSVYFNNRIYHFSPQG